MLQEELQREQPAATPVKKARLRPHSEQLLGRSRPRPTHEDDEGRFIFYFILFLILFLPFFFLGVISILDAATNDLALLIKTLDLQATLMTPDLTPLRPSPLPALPVEEVSAEYDDNPKRKALVAESPLKKTLRSSMSSISSFRPYAQFRGAVKSNASRPSIIL